MTDYNKPVDTLLAELGVVMTYKVIGDDCPTFCEDKHKYADEIGTFPRKHHIHGQHHLVTFTRGDKSFTVDYWNSYADAEHNAQAVKWSQTDYSYRFTAEGRKAKKTRRFVTAYDVLSCLTWYDPGTFEDFCSLYAYDTDSRKAEITYRAVQEEHRNITKMFTPEEIDRVQEVAQ